LLSFLPLGSKHLPCFSSLSERAFFWLLDSTLTFTIDITNTIPKRMYIDTNKDVVRIQVKQDK
jgi:hypothetical protein